MEIMSGVVSLYFDFSTRRFAGDWGLSVLAVITGETPNFIDAEALEWSQPRRFSKKSRNQRNAIGRKFCPLNHQEVSDGSWKRIWR